MIELALAIVAAWLLLEFGGFVLALIIAIISRWRADVDDSRALGWWESLTTDEQAQWKTRVSPSPPSQAGILRAWQEHRTGLWQ